jgi:hypothetical protein
MPARYGTIFAACGQHRFPGLEMQVAADIQAGSCMDVAPDRGPSLEVGIAVVSYAKKVPIAHLVACYRQGHGPGR